MKLKRVLSAMALIALTCLLAGCHLGMHFISEPMQSRVINASSGERYYFTLEENSGNGAKWSAKCDDPDVEVTVDHSPEDNVAKVRIRIHRGFDGPACVRFSCRTRVGIPPEGFTISFYKRTGDQAFWE